MAFAHLVTVEVFGVTVPACARLLAGLRILTFISVIGMEVVVDMATKVGWTMEPGTGSNEDTAAEPLWTVVAIRGAGVGRSVVVPVGTVWRYANTNGHLSRGG